MFTNCSAMTPRFARNLLSILLGSACLSFSAGAQSLPVVSSSAAALSHPIGWSQIWNSAIDSKGDFVVLDWVNYGVYEFPANGGPAITVAAPGQLVSGSTKQYWDMGLGIDKNDRIFTGANYLSQEGLFSAPYDPATGTWDLSTYTETAEDAVAQSYFQSAAITAAPNSNTLIIGDEDGKTGIFTVTYDPATLKFGTPVYVITGLQKRARSIAMDAAGNIYFYEDGGAAGVLRIPAGVTGLTSETGLTRVDPSLASIQGVTTDAAGNVYIGDQSAGVYRVPNEAGTPNPVDAVLLTPATAQGTPSLDQARGILYVPTSGWNGFTDVVKIYLNRAELGSTAVATTSATPGTIYYTFNGPVTPHSFAIQEAGSAGDFAVATGGTCSPDTAYAANGSCTVKVSLTPHAVGDVSATLVMLDANGNKLAATLLHGVGQGSAIVAMPSAESAIGASLKTPAQVAVDAAHNVYVADSGLGQVLQFSKGAGATATPVSIGTGITAPTGVAVDGTGDVFIASSGSVIEVPYGQGGLNTAGQVTLKSGLGTNLKLAADAVGDVFVSDPDNQRVVKLGDVASFGITGVDETDIPGFSQLKAIAADGAGDLFVSDGTNLLEVPTTGMQTTLLTSLTGVNGLAVDASGSLYVTSSNGSIRIPSVSGTLTVASQQTIAPAATMPTAVAVDPQGNTYVTDAAAEDVDFVSVNGALNLGTLNTPSASAGGLVSIVNSGNAALNITGFSSTADFSETASTCVGGPIAVGSTCSTTVTFSPGAGDQGPLQAQLAIQSDAGNAPVAINVNGVGAALAASVSTITVKNPSVTNAPIVVTVASQSASAPVPTGNVTLSVTNNAGATLTDTQALVNGTFTFNEAALTAGAHTFTVNYSGDRVYGTSSASTTATVGVGGLVLVQPAASAVPTYVLSGGTGAQEPFDGSQIPFYYNYPLVVKTANGTPLIGVPVYNSAGTQISTDYGIVTFNLASGGAACPAVKVNADGTAPFPTSCFTINTSNNQIPNIETTYTVTPVYSGNTDTNYGTAMGIAVTFTALRNPMVVITSDPAAVNLAAGSTTAANLTLTSLLGYGTAGAAGTLNNYSLPLELECDNLPAHASCTFSYPTPDPSDPNSVAVTTTTPGKVMMTINTNLPVGTSTASVDASSTVYAAMFGFSLLGLALGRRKTLRANIMRAVFLILFSGAIAGLSACSSANIAQASVLNTPKGTYNVTVTAKQVGSKTVAGNTPGSTVLVQGNGNQMSIPFTVPVTIQ